MAARISCARRGSKACGKLCRRPHTIVASDDGWGKRANFAIVLCNGALRNWRNEQWNRDFWKATTKKKRIAENGIGADIRCDICHVKHIQHMHRAATFNLPLSFTSAEILFQIWSCTSLLRYSDSVLSYKQRSFSMIFTKFILNSWSSRILFIVVLSASKPASNLFCYLRDERKKNQFIYVSPNEPIPISSTDTEWNEFAAFKYSFVSMNLVSVSRDWWNYENQHLTWHFTHYVLCIVCDV